MRPPTGQEYNSMARAILSKLIIICFGLQLSLEESVSNNCGRLYYDEPAVAGRNVTLKFEPVQTDGDLTVIWKTTTWNILWSEVSEERNYHLDNFSLVIKSSNGDQGRQFYTDYGSCSSEVITLKLEVIDIHSCGMWYKRTSNVRPGGTVELGYLPTWNIINNEANYVRIFLVMNSTCTEGCQIQDLPGVYEIRALDYNHEYVLAINLRETFVNGNYSLRCTRDRLEGHEFTDYIEVSIPESPNIPDLLNKQSIEDCHNCLVGNLNDSLDIRCNVTGGTEPLQVNITVAGKSTNVITTEEGINVANIRLTTKRHMANVACSVSNLALDSPLMSEARLYILVNPLEPVFDVPELRDDASPTYPTCTSSGARPPSDVTLNSSNSDIIKASKMNRTEMANLYNTSITLNRMDKDWNLHNLTCCVSHLTYTSPLCRTKQLMYKFKPRSVRVALADNYTAILSYYTYNVTCTVRRAYPACSVTWVWPEGVDKLDSTEVLDGTNVVTTKADISLNVSREDNGKEVTCTAVCADVDFNQAYIHVIFVPCLPDQHTSAKTDGESSSMILVIIMTCIVLLLAAVVLVVVLKKRNSKKSEMVQNNSTVPAAGPSGSVVSYASVQESDIYSTPLPKSQRPKADNSKTVQDDDTYAMPLPKSQRNNANTANVKSAAAPKELIYADLDLQPSSTSGSGATAKPVMRKDGPETEYVDIDFNKKAAPLPDLEKEDNVYANQ